MKLLQIQQDQATDTIDIEEEPLALKEVKMNEKGLLTMEFNRQILKPPFRLKDDNSDADRRILEEVEESTASIEIKDFLKLSVEENEDQLSLDKSIESYFLEAISDTMLTIGVVFSQKSAISPDISEPEDNLKVEILLPELIVDAKTFKALEESKIDY